jgi:hypothetical protein
MSINQQAHPTADQFLAVDQVDALCVCEANRHYTHCIFFSRLSPTVQPQHVVTQTNDLHKLRAIFITCEFAQINLNNNFTHLNFAF